jgi:succinate dehydrogenase flavin-adding protein (antitoxin of CptAB toxin-antitoxin module)
MKTTFKTYLAEENVDLLHSFILLKKRILELLKEDVSNDAAKKYLKFLAIFEQYFRHLSSVKMDPSEIPGLGSFIGQQGVNNPDENKLQRFIDKAIETLEPDHYINFKSIVDRRTGEFTKWFTSQQKGGLQIIADSLDYVIREVEKYRLSGARLSA